MNDWVSQGHLKNDHYAEFFVMENQKDLSQMSAREHWQKAYVVRSVNLNELLGHH